MIVLMTDFGVTDGYVASMKGVIASTAPDTLIVDATHDIAPQDVSNGAWVLASYITHYPPGTIHVAVVDPGVGTNRSLLLVEAGGQKVLAPDNGLLSIWLNGVDDYSVRKFRPDWHRPGGQSATFHGRDILAYASGLLATGRLGDDALEAMTEPLTLLPESKVDVREDRLTGRIIYIDRFGNSIAGITAAHLAEMKGRPKRVILPYGEKLPFKRTYADVAEGKSLGLLNSSDHVEIATRAGNASVIHGLIKGAEISIQF